MSKKLSKVSLTAKSKAEGKKPMVREFTIEHAERLLKMSNNGGWALSDNTKFKFTKEDGITSK